MEEQLSLFAHRARYEGVENYLLHFAEREEVPPGLWVLISEFREQLSGLDDYFRAHNVDLFNGEK